MFFLCVLFVKELSEVERVDEGLFFKFLLLEFNVSGLIDVIEFECCVFFLDVDML